MTLLAVVVTELDHCRENFISSDWWYLFGLRVELTSIRKVHPSRLSSFRVVFLASAWQSSLEGWSSRASRGLARSRSWRQGASVSARTNGITSAGLDAPAALRASKLRALLMVSPRQPASNPPSKHLDTFRDLSLQFGSLGNWINRHRLGEFPIELELVEGILTKGNFFFFFWWKKRGDGKFHLTVEWPTIVLFSTQVDVWWVLTRLWLEN